MIKHIILALAVILTLAGCTKKGDQYWDTTPVPTTAKVTMSPIPTK